MKALHDLLMRWATPNRMTFSPHKYSILHFRKPYTRKTTLACMLLPNIPRLKENEKKVLLVPKIGATADAQEASAQEASAGKARAKE